MNYHHLLYFKTIAEHGSVSRAATLLRLGQPTLSAQLKQFEDSMGVTLFHRQGKRLTLTEHGKVALEYAKDIFTKGGELYQALQQSRSSTTSIYRVGALDGIAKQIILSLTQASRSFFEARIVISEGQMDNLIRELDSGRIDVVISNFIPDYLDRKSFSHKMISKQPVAIYASPKLKHLQKNFPQSINNIPIVMPTYDSRIRYDIEHWGRINRIIFDVVVESQDIAVKKLLAIEGIGVMPAASHTVQRQLANQDLIEIGNLSSIYEEIHLIIKDSEHKHKISDYLMKQFILPRD
jgi:LysR family transcriptional activator of nhaA